MTEKFYVLYADDDNDDLQIVSEAFADYSPHIELVTVSDGYEALSYLESIETAMDLPCLIILDVNMPRMNGIETLVQLRKMDRFENVPVILFTTSSYLNHDELIKKHKAIHMTKPVSYSQTEFIIDKFVSHCSDDVKLMLRR